MALKKNQVYSTVFLKRKFGGSIVPSMPLVQGKVPYAKYERKINPNFPGEVWIEVGPLRKAGALYLSTCKSAVPVFEKVATGKWRYIGTFRFKDVSTARLLSRINQKAPRDKIAFVLKLY